LIPDRHLYIFRGPRNEPALPREYRAASRPFA